MAQTPLYVHHKEKLRDLIVRHRFDPVKDRLDQEEHEIASAIYHRLYTRAEIDYIASAPTEAFAKRISFGAKYGVSGRDYGSFDLKEDGYRVFGNRTTTIVLEPTEPLAERIVQYTQDRKTLADSRNDARKQVYVALDKYRTFEKLVADWPEIRLFAEKVKPQIRQLPAVDYSTLNTLLDLPPEEIAA